MEENIKPSELIDKLLDKINKSGIQSLSYDEKTYLNDFNINKRNIDLENWLYSLDESTFNEDGHKLSFEEFEYDEDIFYNHKKLISVLSKHLNTMPFSNNADWGSGNVWNVMTDDKYLGTFIYLGDEELVLLNRVSNNDGYEDKILKEITNTKELYDTLLFLKKSENFKISN